VIYGTRKKGIATEEETKQAILAYLSDSEEHSSQQILNALEPDVSKATIYKYLLKDHNSLVEEGMVERKAGSKEVSFRPRYCITEKGLKKYHQHKTFQANLDALKKLSRKELEERLYKRELIDDIIRISGQLSFGQRITVLKELKEQGDTLAAKKLEDIEKGLERLSRYEKEVAEAPPDKKFGVLMKWHREREKLKQSDETNKEIEDFKEWWVDYKKTEKR